MSDKDSLTHNTFAPSNKELIRAAFAAAQCAYAPYSHFHVGAALLSANNRLFTGCNIENAAFSPSNCAERTAFFKAISEGIQDFKKIAIVCYHDHDKPEFCTPCGVCLQVMSEFCREDFEVIVAKDENTYQSYLLSDLLPHAFSFTKKESNKA